jgi:hypothetical protein
MNSIGFGDEGSQPAGGGLHPRFFRGRVTDQDEGLWAPLGHGIPDVFHGFPLAALARYQDCDVVPRE